jgi:hypothetical protein
LEFGVWSLEFAVGRHETRDARHELGSWELGYGRSVGDSGGLDGTGRLGIGCSALCAQHPVPGTGHRALSVWDCDLEVGPVVRDNWTSAEVGRISACCSLAPRSMLGLANGAAVVSWSWPTEDPIPTARSGSSRSRRPRISLGNTCKRRLSLCDRLERKRSERAEGSRLDLLPPSPCFPRLAIFNPSRYLPHCLDLPRRSHLPHVPRLPYSMVLRRPCCCRNHVADQIPPQRVRPRRPRVRAHQVHRPAGCGRPR